jgi:hypothetical protein
MKSDPGFKAIRAGQSPYIEPTITKAGSTPDVSALCDELRQLYDKFLRNAPDINFKCCDQAATALQALEARNAALEEWCGKAKARFLDAQAAIQRAKAAEAALANAKPLLDAAMALYRHIKARGHPARYNSLTSAIYTVGREYEAHLGGESDG